MDSDKHNKKLDELISQAIGRDRPTFDFDKWRKDHQKEIQIYELQAGAGVRTPRQADVWRIIMKSQVTKFAAAAAIIIVAGLLITFLGTSEPAYALPQTIKANHSVRYLHVKDFTAGTDEPKEFWVECDELGAVKCARLHIPEWESPEDGAKIAVWKENQADVWFKKKNFFARFRDKLVADRMLKMVEECDPKLAVERLYEQQTQGKVVVDINEPHSRADLIVVTATYSPESPTPGRCLVLFVDQA
ncbi:MAG: hypothetical protein ACYS21_08905, partial [Planctomycetota bacterium]